jgi:hypothetical protein
MPSLLPLVVLLVFAGLFGALYLAAVYWPEEAEQEDDSGEDECD